MERHADALERRSEDIAQTVCVQNGMPVAQGRQLEGPYPVAVLRYYARLCTDTATEDTRDGLLGGRVVVRREPIGVVAAIVPWKVPQILAAPQVRTGIGFGMRSGAQTSARDGFGLLCPRR